MHLHGLAQCMRKNGVTPTSIPAFSDTCGGGLAVHNYLNGGKRTKTVFKIYIASTNFWKIFLTYSISYDVSGRYCSIIANFLFLTGAMIGSVRGCVSSSCTIVWKITLFFFFFINKYNMCKSLMRREIHHVNRKLMIKLRCCAGEEIQNISFFVSQWINILDVNIYLYIRTINLFGCGIIFFIFM